MFHFWFNTFFIREEEHTDLMNGSGTSQCISATPSLLVMSHYHQDQHKLLASSSLPVSFASSQQAHNSAWYATCYNNSADKKHYSGNQIHPESSSIQLQYQNESSVSSGQYHKPSQSTSAAAAPAQQHENQLQPIQANSGNTSNNSFTATTQVKRPLCEPPAHRKQTYRTLTLKKMEIDKANKDKQHKLFHENFQVSFIFVGLMCQLMPNRVYVILCVDFLQVTLIYPEITLLNKYVLTAFSVHTKYLGFCDQCIYFYSSSLKLMQLLLQQS